MNAKIHEEDFQIAVKYIKIVCYVPKSGNRKLLPLRKLLYTQI